MAKSGAYGDFRLDRGRSVRDRGQRGHAATEQLEQVVSKSHQSELASRRLKTAQEKLPHVARRLELSEHGLDDRFAHLVERPSCVARELVSHAVRRGCRGVVGAGQRGLTVLLT